MPLWQIALLTLVGAWALQALGTFLQMRHFSATMGNVAQQWPDGYVGAGNAKTTFGAGLILLLVVSPDRIVRRALVMRGRTIFARFSRMPDLEGKALDSLPDELDFRNKVASGALAKAMQQIQKVATRGAA